MSIQCVLDECKVERVITVSTAASDEDRSHRSVAVGAGRVSCRVRLLAALVRARSSDVNIHPPRVLQAVETELDRFDAFLQFVVDIAPNQQWDEGAHLGVDEQGRHSG